MEGRKRGAASVLMEHPRNQDVSFSDYVSLRCSGHPYKSIMRYSDSKKGSIDGRHVPIFSDVATRADPPVAQQRSRYSLLAPLPPPIQFYFEFCEILANYYL
ncbi:hypothetical protein CDAR_393811 [Caerostris darwini]|uniref:Uncharacterized protein n=1 Tax=Caerostris darwini TaxID=1538125 RepID=A0AAV4PCS9_9ARAC|nr:hypothetical protein CDAR_393811 [Caerostris darwini]